jgi:signal transduction histidine kinase
MGWIGTEMQPLAAHTTYWLRAVSFPVILASLYSAHILRMRSVTKRLKRQSDKKLRVTRELHDTLLQSIHGLMLHFHFATEALPENEPVRAPLLAALARADEVFVKALRRIEQLRDEAAAETDSQS